MRASLRPGTGQCRRTHFRPDGRAPLDFAGPDEETRGAVDAALDVPANRLMRALGTCRVPTAEGQARDVGPQGRAARDCEARVMTVAAGATLIATEELRPWKSTWRLRPAR